MRLISILSIVYAAVFRLQRARFKAVESLYKDTAKGSRAVVVCTDVAARGLDIPSVATVVHYDVARTVDTFVHRAGRTAVSSLTVSCVSFVDGVGLYEHARFGLA